ncbi:MAG: hypothetical protein M3126_01665 [Candidatus Eremiobacteraeota bacterium]|nr:hypothetical protein [Candidatus Eremiobacteraeota bacterium]
MKVKTTGLFLAALLSIVAPLAAYADTLTLPQGTELNVTVDQTIDSKSANAGDQFTAHVQPPYPYDNQGLAGAFVTGHVLKVTRAGPGTKPEVDINFDTIQLSDGSTSPMSAYVSSAQPKTQMKNGARVAAFTIGGMLVGSAIVKTLFLGKGGGIGGAVGGFLIGNNYKADIQFPQGSAMTVKMREALAIRRQAHP